MVRVNPEAVRKFKAAFRISQAGTSPDLVTNRSSIPESVRDLPGVKLVLDQLDARMDVLRQEALDLRSGKDTIFGNIVRDGGSSSKKVADLLDKDEVDLDQMRRVTGGKGAGKATNVQQAVAQAEEQLKDAVAAAMLQVASAKEDRGERIDALGDAMGFCTNETYTSPSRNSKLVEACAEALGLMLGLNLDGVRGASADALKSRYIDKVYALMKMDARAARDTGPRGKIEKLMFSLRAISPDSVEEGDNRALLQKLVASDIGNNVLMNSSRAGRYSEGGMEEKKLAPDVPEWPEGLTIPVKGNEAFRDIVSADLAQFAKTDAGQKLLEAIKATGKDVYVQPPSVASAQREGDDGEVFYAMSSSNGKVSYDPNNNIAGEEAGDEEWRKRDAAVSLYHEMIHGLIAGKGGETWVANNDPELELSITDTSDEAELRIVGIKLVTEIKGKRAVFNWDDPAYNPITVNQYRIDLAKSKGETKALLRPYYAKIPGQVKVSPTEVNI